MKKTILLLVLIFFISCASSVRFQPFDNIIYPPTQKIDVYSIEKPTKKYVEIGRIEVTEGAGGGNDMMNQALQKAKRVGADGLILLQENKDTGYIVTGQMILPGTVKHLIFIAIKYVD